ncbi:glycoside hydrolase family 25 protein [Rhizobium ruizarguesonis]|uniref:glycoside hydrolase family 25 protein n=1 Tax=Rhizobium ruizarguesonis TaxID=2081791 RepID=UPI00103276B0|nr:glycoside hydrolase family 25 protein [Rhizobium ruizarguesonis]TBD71728.1 glycoside hydrolase [Rhizobium ruizarguesonis]TBD94885.1 glycoside hydrolase [Rhizobium ruizarguesonis]TBE14543.1 glycoside hydrolase [Rhizobium ruizarguesonis]TBE14727.1 glycoside hydrolase [Rhizobium ruizarguesonis]WSH04934.1 glycoside hydrolase family 25 protein [Rhizobium ruizarguesonis]
MAEVPRIIDLYHGDSVTSFDAARTAGLQAVIHKATTGASGRDNKYAERRSAALKSGLLWGAYHWGTAAPVVQQIDNFLQFADPDKRTLVALDFERTRGNQMSIEQAAAFLKGIADKLGRKAVIYGGSLLKESLGSSKNEFFGSHRLWLAQYGDTPTPHKSWQDYWLWQYTDGGRNGPGPKKVPGVVGNTKGQIDCDQYRMPFAQLKAEWAS